MYLSIYTWHLLELKNFRLPLMLWEIHWRMFCDITISIALVTPASTVLSTDPGNDFQVASNDL